MDMHAAVLHGIGQTPRYELFTAPVAGEAESVVTVSAAALKPSDRFMADGVAYAPTAFPRLLAWTGWDVSRTGRGWRS
jgi:NADPH:quinone reductase-like Zn-dependent oxidoreductase